MLWKTLAGRCIYHSATGIQIFDNFFYRWLKLDSDALQTVIYKFAPGIWGLNYINALVFAAKSLPGNCCLLGLGGAGAAHALLPFMQDFELTAVELNKEIIDIAAEYFMTNNLLNLKIVNSDANEYMIHCQHKFQHILVDLFGAHNYPSSCNNEVFFSYCKKNLLPGGILAVNLANIHEQRGIFKLINSVFAGNTIAIPVAKCANLVIFASEDLDFLLDQLRGYKHLKSLKWDQEWGYVAEF